jgi:hypothetical protein
MNPIDRRQILLAGTAIAAANPKILRQCRTAKSCCRGLQSALASSGDMIDVTTRRSFLAAATADKKVIMRESDPI